MVTRRVALLAPGPDGTAAWALLTSIDDAAVRISLDDLSQANLGFDVLWIHTEDEPPPLPGAILMRWVEGGGRLLLTQRATGRVVALGLESDGPNDTVPRTWRHADDELWFPELRSFGAFPHVRGLAAYGPHPLFDGLGQGTYVWAPEEGEGYAQATYARGRRPALGRVVACERSYVHLNADRIVAWEYGVGRGGVLCIGAFVVPGARDPSLVLQLRRMLRNALAGGGIPHADRTEPAATWPEPGRTAREDSNLVLPDRVRTDGPLPGLESPLHVWSRAQHDDPLLLTGRRAMVVGGEQRGVSEVWVHPYRVLQDLTVTIGGESPLVRDVQITPNVVQRHLVSRARIVEEGIAVALEHSVVFLDYRPEKIGRARGLRVGAELALRWRVDLRRSWPYPAGCGGNLRYRLGAGGGTLLVTDATGLPRAAFRPSAPVEWRVHADPDCPVLHCELRMSLDAPFRLMLCGGATRSELEAAVAVIGRRGVQGLSAQRQRHEVLVREHQVRLRCPEESVNRAFDWAKLRLDGCLVETPGVGRSLVAGYAASGRGWGEGRPGYAWYFGRDACWTAMALLALGDAASCRLALRFLGTSQDVTGKVIHEVSTSGLAHYDAADATPLFLLLAGRYAAWTGDVAFLAERWAELERAYRYCLSTDRDGDGLIENTGVGHGWIETGPLSGSHVTLYLASIWTAALSAIEPVARALGRAALADELAERASRARAQIARFLTTDGYVLGLLPDGTPQRHRTALTAVALLLGAIEPETAREWLAAIATSGFSTPWGVRLIAREDPLYSPRGYHTGAVWPLYTGWASLAEYASHQGEAGFAHLMANARLPFSRGKGMFDEVLDGDTGAPAGVCPDQAWSAAMLIAPLIEGMLGARPDAIANRLVLTPHLPAAWDDCEWRGLHVGQTTLDVRVRRRPHGLTVGLRRIAGGRLDLVVAPGLSFGSGGAAIEAIADDQPIAPRRFERMGCTHAEVRLEVSDEHEIQFWHHPE
jgi:Mannosylglycerate hydrolase MGH1-like glycoside hydrolase domain